MSLRWSFQGICKEEQSQTAESSTEFEMPTNKLARNQKPTAFISRADK